MSTEEFALRGDGQPIELQQSGITLIAPGLIGGGREVSTDVQTAGRDFTRDTAEIDRALAEADLEQRHTILVEAQTPPASGAGRAFGAIDDDEIALQVPLGDGEAAFLVYTDEAGQASFHYGQVATGAALPTRALRAARQEQFRIRLRPGVDRAHGDGRGLFGKITAKAIRVIVVKIFPDQVGAAVARRVQAWEARHRACLGIHGGPPEDLLAEAPKPVALEKLKGRRSLLFLHGTTSSTAGAFGSLKGNPGLLHELYRRYEDCVVGFNHHTLAVDVRTNVRDFHEALRGVPGDYVFDVVCHSRGGLVARALAGLVDPSPGVRLHINRVVFVGTPNSGTDLAIPDRIPDFVERLTNYVNMLPDSAGTIAAGALLSIAGSIAEVTLPRLPGLADQAPGSELLKSLALAPASPRRDAAFQAEFSASGNLAEVIKDRVADRIFGDAANDLVVPTEGVSRDLQIDRDRIVAFRGSDGVHHTNFFANSKIAEIARFLAG